MAKALTKSQIATTVAELVGVTKKQAVQTLDLLAQLAYKQAKNTFTLPGVGKLVLAWKTRSFDRNSQCFQTRSKWSVANDSEACFVTITVRPHESEVV